MIEAFRELDKSVIRSILTRPDIWKTIAEDGQDVNDFEPDLAKTCYLSMKTGKGQIVGMYLLHAFNGITTQIHANIFPEFRKQHSKDTGRAALEWVFNHHPEYKKVVAIIPLCYKNVRDFTCSFGFTEEGVIRQSYLKNGQILDQWLLGITRDEIGAYLNG